MISTITTGRHGFVAGDIVQLSTGWVFVLETTQTTVVVRPYRWYERAWDWAKRVARRALRRGAPRD